MLNGLGLILYKNIYVAYAKRLGRSNGFPPSEHHCPDSPRCPPPKAEDEWLQGGSSVWHPEMPSVAIKLAVAYAQAVTGWDGVSSCVFGNVGCFLPLQLVI